ncbi:hypothetical protein [Metamycoplasma neophronis]|uniref:Uncharacterized protein n=1 Tax=Metamycoplasma neophronis TaxID=872983 RepID=A0ABY2YZG9_9BACT|nr:hypothetical protein [Metamycoplasma neophronis]TPR53539.1 hypothetical protein FJR74_02515 [Metamycoplasma neophronis]
MSCNKESKCCCKKTLENVSCPIKRAELEKEMQAGNCICAHEEKPSCSMKEEACGMETKSSCSMKEEGSCSMKKEDSEEKCNCEINLEEVKCPIKRAELEKKIKEQNCNCKK